MHVGVVTALLATLLLAGCAGDTPSSSATPSAPSDQTPSPHAPTATTVTPPTTAAPAVTPSVPTAGPDPGADEEASAEGYVAPVFETQDLVATAADPAAFADVNPIDYRNPWR